MSSSTDATTGTIEDAQRSIVPGEESGVPSEFPPLGPEWHKPSKSGNNGQCVEARFVDGIVEVRNSNNPGAGVVRFTREEWWLFIEAADTEFRLP